MSEKSGLLFGLGVYTLGSNLSLCCRVSPAEGSKEAEQLREAALLERARVKEAELEAERWAEQSRKLQTEAEAHDQEITQLKQERQRNQEAINRCVCVCVCVCVCISHRLFHI